MNQDPNIPPVPDPYSEPYPEADQPGGYANQGYKRPGNRHPFRRRMRNEGMQGSAEYPRHQPREFQPAPRPIQQPELPPDAVMAYSGLSPMERIQSRQRGVRFAPHEGFESIGQDVPLDPLKLDEIVNGDFDRKQETLQAKRILQPSPDAPKLHKVLAQAGIGSRRDMEDLIATGAVKVNGEVAHLGQRILSSDLIEVNGAPVKPQLHRSRTPRVLLYHKPVGEIVAVSDPEGRPTVFQNLPQIDGAKWIAVGRLDLNTEGLLLFTTSGDLAHRFMHPSFNLEREYVVRVSGELTPAMRDSLTQGVNLDDGQAKFLKLEELGGEGLNRWYRVTLTEGRNREVRRMFESVGLMVSRLLRVRYGDLHLPDGMKRGDFMELSFSQTRTLMKQLGLKLPGERPMPSGGGQYGHGGHGQYGQYGAGGHAPAAGAAPRTPLTQVRRRRNYLRPGGYEEQAQRPGYGGQGGAEPGYAPGGGYRGPRSYDRPPFERSFDRPYERPGERPAERPGERGFDRPHNRFENRFDNRDNRYERQDRPGGPPAHVGRPGYDRGDRPFRRAEPPGYPPQAGYAAPQQVPEGVDEDDGPHPSKIDPMQTALGFQNRFKRRWDNTSKPSGRTPDPTMTALGTFDRNSSSNWRGRR